MNTINSFEDACAALKINPSLPDLSMIPVRDQKALLAHYKLMIIIRAKNEGWEPDWNDTDQPKYFNWPDVDANDDTPSGSGLSSPLCVDTGSCTVVGSRLSFKTGELALETFNQFKELYEEYFILKP